MMKSPALQGFFEGEIDLPPKKKYYAVKKGRETGIFTSWADCQKQVTGFAGALFKGFVTREEADAYLGQEKKQHADGSEKTAQREDAYHIYVDGSYFNQQYSWGFAVYYQDALVFTKNGVGTSAEAAKLHNVAGELEAVKEAVCWAETEKLPAVIIFHDYIGISEWAENRWKTNNAVTLAYKEFMQPYLGWVSFQKVSGHTGVEGNELADQLARSALEKLQQV